MLQQAVYLSIVITQISMQKALMLQQQIIFTIQIIQRLVRMILLSLQILLAIIIQEEMVILLRIH